MMVISAVLLLRQESLPEELIIQLTAEGCRQLQDDIFRGAKLTDISEAGDAVLDLFVLPFAWSNANTI